MNLQFFGGGGASSGKKKSTSAGNQYKIIKSFEADRYDYWYDEKRVRGYVGARGGNVHGYEQIPSSNGRKLMNEIMKLPVASQVDVTFGEGKNVKKHTYTVVSKRESGVNLLYLHSAELENDIGISKNPMRFKENRQLLFNLFKNASKVELKEKYKNK